MQRVHPLHRLHGPPRPFANALAGQSAPRASPRWLLQRVCRCTVGQPTTDPNVRRRPAAEPRHLTCQQKPKPQRPAHATTDERCGRSNGLKNIFISCCAFFFSVGSAHARSQCAVAFRRQCHDRIDARSCVRLGINVISPSPLPLPLGTWPHLSPSHRSASPTARPHRCRG